MGYESRGNQQYFYRKRRVGSKVVSEYAGSGSRGVLAAYEQATESEEKARKRAEFERFKAIERENQKPLGTAEKLIRDLTRATFMANGYHRHAGQWRRRRDNSAG